MIGRAGAACMALCTVLAAASCDNAGKAKAIRVNDKVRHQTIDNFGASDAWTMRFLGEASDATVRQTADWLFSMECDAAGQPLGIGLSIWRFNLTAGSAEQGDESQINEFTRGESFFTEDGTYDWEKLRGQRRMLREARARGVEHFLMFLNSPDVRFTQNGLATNTGRGDTYNLKPGCADAWASYMADVVEGIARHDSVRFDYGIPFMETINNPQYQYRLNHGKWSEPTSMPTKEYSNLPYGDYAFEVRTTFPDGTLASDRLSFSILPPWYHTIWAYCCYVVLVLLAMWAAYRWERLRVSREKQQAVVEKDRQMHRMEQEYEEEKARQEKQIMLLEKYKLYLDLQH